jgi:hypothetical protein
MSKLRLILIIIVTCLATSASFGELFSFQAPAVDNKKPNAAPGTPAPALSPSEFKNKVNTLGQKAQQNMLQQSQENLKQQTNQLNLPNTLPTPPKLPQSPTATTDPNPQNPATAPKDLFGNTPAQTEQQPALPPEQPIAKPTMPSSAPPVAPPTTPIAPAPQNDVYTGFGGGAQKNPTSGGSTQQSGGWNIKY